MICFWFCAVSYVLTSDDSKFTIVPRDQAIYFLKKLQSYVVYFQIHLDTSSLLGLNVT